MSIRMDRVIILEKSISEADHYIRCAKEEIEYLKSDEYAKLYSPKNVNTKQTSMYLSNILVNVRNSQEPIKWKTA